MLSLIALIYSSVDDLLNDGFYELQVAPIVGLMTVDFWILYGIDKMFF